MPTCVDTENEGTGEEAGITVGGLVGGWIISLVLVAVLSVMVGFHSGMWLWKRCVYIINMVFGIWEYWLNSSL